MNILETITVNSTSSESIILQLQLRIATSYHFWTKFSQIILCHEKTSIILSELSN